MLPQAADQSTPMIFNERGRLGPVDPRVKIVWLLATLIAGLIFAQPRSLLIVLASIVAVAAVGGVLLRRCGACAGWPRSSWWWG